MRHKRAPYIFMKSSALSRPRLFDQFSVLYDLAVRSDTETAVSACVNLYDVFRGRSRYRRRHRKWIIASNTLRTYKNASGRRSKQVSRSSEARVVAVARSIARGELTSAQRRQQRKLNEPVGSFVAWLERPE